MKNLHILVMLLVLVLTSMIDHKCPAIYHQDKGSLDPYSPEGQAIIQKAFLDLKVPSCYGLDSDRHHEKCCSAYWQKQHCSDPKVTSWQK